MPLMKRNPINLEEETYLITGDYEEYLQLVTPCTHGVYTYKNTHGICTYKKKQSLSRKRCNVTGEDSAREMDVTERKIIGFICI